VPSIIQAAIARFLHNADADLRRYRQFARRRASADDLPLAAATTASKPFPSEDRTTMPSHCNAVLRAPRHRLFRDVRLLCTGLLGLCLAWGSTATSAAPGWNAVDPTGFHSTASALAGFPFGHVLLTAYVNGVPSAARPMLYAAAPIVTSIAPVNGPTGGGTPVTIAGTGFTGVSSSSATTPAGNALIFRIVTTNSGTAAGNAVSFNDAVPPLLTYVPGSGKFATAANTNYAAATALTEGAGGYSFSSNTVAYNPGAPAGTVAAAGGVLVLFFKATIAGAPVNTQITNTATVGYKDTGGNAHAPISASADVTVTTMP